MPIADIVALRLSSPEIDGKNLYAAETFAFKTSLSIYRISVGKPAISLGCRGGGL